MIPNQEGQQVIRQAFQLHFDLFATTDACSRGVENCAQTDFRRLMTSIEQTLRLVSRHRQACNPIVRSMVTRTLELLSHYT